MGEQAKRVVLVLAGGLGVMVLGCAGCMGLALLVGPIEQPERIGGPEGASAVAEPVEVAGPVMSAETYRAIREGMTLREVIEVAGDPAEEMASSAVAGVRTRVLRWDGVGGWGANAVLTFQDGRLVAKAQAGL